MTGTSFVQFYFVSVIYIIYNKFTTFLSYHHNDCKYTGAPVVGTPILGTHYIVSCDAEVCGAERESSRMIQERMH